MRQVDLFENEIDKMFKQGSLTKAMLLDVFHKCNPNSLAEVKNEEIRESDKKICSKCGPK